MCTYLLVTRNTSSLFGPLFSRLSVAPPSAGSRCLSLLKPHLADHARSLLRVKPSRRHAGTRAGRASGADVTHVGWLRTPSTSGPCMRAPTAGDVCGHESLSRSRSPCPRPGPRERVWLDPSLAVSSGLGSVRLRARGHWVH